MASRDWTHRWILGALVGLLITVGGAEGGTDSQPVLPRTLDEAVAADYKRLVVRVEVGDRAELDQVAALSEPWDVDPEEGWMIIDVDRAGLQRLVDLGYEVRLEPKLTLRLNQPLAPLPGQRSGIPGFPCYRTVPETLASGQAMAASYPNLATWTDIGDSWEKVTPGGLDGHDIMVLELTNSAVGRDKPALWVQGSIHARELTTAETVTRFAEHLLANYDVDPDVTWLLDHHEIHLLLMANPDGRLMAETGAYWRKNTNSNTCPDPDNWGVDLNRNFDFGWDCCGGSSSDGCSGTYHGSAPGSEPETESVQDQVAAIFSDWRPDDLTTPAPDETTGIFIDVHSSGGDVLTAFGFAPLPAPNDAQTHKLGRRFSFFTGYHARVGGIYQVDGSTNDWAYGRLGIPAFTFELGTTFFEACSLFESTIYPDNLQALLYAARVVRAPYLTPSGPEVIGPTVVPNVVAVATPAVATASVDDDRYGPGETSPATPVHNISAAEVYIDVPPWEATASPIAMTAVDGVFDDSVESVTATVDTTGLADGRHLIFFRAADGAGNWGLVSAAFLWVIDPVTAAHFAGSVEDSSSSAPLQASIVAGAFTAASATDGSYDLMLPAGVYDLTASAPGYGPETVSGLVATSGNTTVQDFSLVAHPTDFTDDVENGNSGWTAQVPWAITSETSSSPSHSWTDSPGGVYGDSRNTSLMSPTLCFSAVSEVVLEFSHIYDIELNYDFGYVEYSADNGETWTAAASYSGSQPSWQTVTLALDELDGASDARIRFRLSTDGMITADGWHIDDIVLAGTSTTTVFSDGFETGDPSGWSFSVGY